MSNGGFHGFAGEFPLGQRRTVAGEFVGSGEAEGRVQEEAGTEDGGGLEELSSVGHMVDLWGEGSVLQLSDDISGCALQPEMSSESCTQQVSKIPDLMATLFFLAINFTEVSSFYAFNHKEKMRSSVNVIFIMI